MKWLFALALAACSCPQQPAATSSTTPPATTPPSTTPTTPPPTTPPSTPPSTPPAQSGPGIGENCGPGDKCGQGACVSYYGIAGANGPQFKTCEIKCNDDKQCPKDLHCATIADGPGRVCR